MTDRDQERDHERADERGAEEARRIRVTDRRRTQPHLQPDPATEAASTGAASAAGVGAGVEAVAPDDAAADGQGSELEAARREAAEHLERLQRVTADFDNARKRMVKDQTRAVEMASERLITRLLDVVDEFQIALAHSEQAPEEFAPYLKGFELVFAKLFGTLRAEGLERIDAVGQPFDPTRHEALMQTGDGDGLPVVAEVFRDGYTFKGKVLRPAGVRVQRQAE